MRPTWNVLFVLAGMTGGSEALFAAQPVSPPSLKEDLAAKIRDAASGFRRPAAADVAAAQQGVQTACQALARKLDARPDGRSVKEALHWDELTALVAAPAAPLDRLDALTRQLGHRSNHIEGTELEALKAAMRVYLQRLRASENDAIADEYMRQIDRLAKAWENYGRSHAAAAGVEVQSICRWLEERGQAETLCQSLRREASHPNHRMHVSAGFLQQALTRDITQPLVSDEMSQGARVHVQGQIKGKLTPVLEPNAQAGVVRIHFVGAGKSQIVANKGRVSLQALGLTDIRATEAAYLTERGLSHSAPQVHVQHRSVPYSASVAARSRLMRRLGSAIVMRVVERKQAESDQQTTRDTQKKIDAEVRRQSAKIVGDANDVLQRFGVFALLGPQPAKTLKISTTAQRIEWLGSYASSSQFAAETSAPAIDVANPALLLQLHESAVNNSENWLAGETINDSDFRELVFETFGLVAVQDRQAAQIPATITFADDQPLAARIDNNRVNVTLRLKAFSCGGVEFNHRIWTVRTSYQLASVDGKVALVRIAPISVQSDSAADVEQLQGALDRFLVEKASSSGKPNPALAALPQLKIARLSLKQGWLTLALVLDSKTAPAIARVAAK